MNVFKKILLGTAIFFGGLFMIAFAVGFVEGVLDGLDNKDKPVVSKVETPKVETAPIPKEDTKVSLKSDKYEEVLPDARATFMEGCVTEGNNSQCSCMYDWMDTNLTNAEFGAVISESNTGNLPEKAWEAVKACYDK